MKWYREKCKGVRLNHSCDALRWCNCRFGEFVESCCSIMMVSSIVHCLNIDKAHEKPNDVKTR